MEFQPCNAEPVLKAMEFAPRDAIGKAMESAPHDAEIVVKPVVFAHMMLKPL